MYFDLTLYKVFEPTTNMFRCILLFLLFHQDDYRGESRGNLALV